MLGDVFFSTNAREWCYIPPTIRWCGVCVGLNLKQKKAKTGGIGFLYMLLFKEKVYFSTMIRYTVVKILHILSGY